MQRSTLPWLVLNVMVSAKGYPASLAHDVIAARMEWLRTPDRAEVAGA